MKTVSPCVAIRPIATVILRGPSYGKRACEARILSTAMMSPASHGNCTQFSKNTSLRCCISSSLIGDEMIQLALYRHSVELVEFYNDLMTALFRVRAVSPQVSLLER